MEDKIKCPTCGGARIVSLGNDQYECEYCGETFTHVTKKQSNEVPPATKKCPYCGSIIPAASQQCHICNNWLNSPSQNVNTASGYQYQPHYSTKSRGVAIVLAFFLGLLGMHKFYLGQNKLGLLYLLLTLCFGWTGVVAAIVYIACFIDCITYITMSKEDFARKYN